MTRYPKKAYISVIKIRSMEKFVDTTDWPKCGTVQIARGKYYTPEIAGNQFDAIRINDERRGRYVYDLYQDDSLFLTGVSPLFLEFLS